MDSEVSFATTPILNMVSAMIPASGPPPDAVPPSIATNSNPYPTSGIERMTELIALISCENHPVGLVTGDAPRAKNSPMIQPMVAETIAIAIVATHESHTRQMNPQFGLRKPSSTGAARCRSSHSGARVNPMPDPAHQVTPRATMAPSTGIAEVLVPHPINRMRTNKTVPISG